jgi:hypothetical protein
MKKHIPSDVKFWFVGILFMIACNLQSQNLITNWSFEDTIPCVNNPNQFSPESAPPWVSVCQSPDYYSQVYCGWNYMAFGYQLPKTGNAFVGSGLYTSITPNYIREVFSAPLIDTLISGHKYCVSFYICFAESSMVAIDRIGALFTSFEVDGFYIFGFAGIPQVENPPGNIISDTTNWVLISGDFIAQGVEQYIAIGNFYDDQNTQVLQVPWGTNHGAYYYFDDISVIDCTVGLSEYSELNFNIYPNPAMPDQQIKLTLDFSANQIEEIKIFSMDGKLVRSENHPLIKNGEIELRTNFEPGVYLIRLQSTSGFGMKKMVVMD